MIVKVRNTPMVVFYVTGDDAREVRSDAEGVDQDSSKPCFCTEAFGQDGFAWETAEAFETDYESSYGQKYMASDAAERKQVKA